MFIKCQNCHRIYDVPVSRLGDSTVAFHCQACGEVFRVNVQKQEDFLDESPLLETSESFVDDAKKEVILPSLVQEEHTSYPPLQSDNAGYALDSDVLESLDDKPLFTIFADEEAAPVHQSPFDKPLFQKEDTILSFWRKNKVFRKILLMAGFFFIFLGLSYVWFGRVYLAHQSGTMERFYQKLGISTEILGEKLVFKDSFFDVIYEQQIPVMLLKGNILNTSVEIQKVPLVQFNLFDEKDNLIQSQTIVPVKESVFAGESIPFETKIKPVNPLVRRVEITFYKGLSP